MVSGASLMQWRRRTSAFFPELSIGGVWTAGPLGQGRRTCVSEEVDQSRSDYLNLERARIGGSRSGSSSEPPIVAVAHNSMCHGTSGRSVSRRGWRMFWVTQLPTRLLRRVEDHRP